MQQTIRVPWTASADCRETIAVWQKMQAAIIRSAYANAEGRTAEELERFLKDRFRGHPLGSWAIHCATLDGIRLRQLKSDGKMVFGGKSNFTRRNKGIISNDEWRALRQQRAIEITGDRTRWGNRHFRLSADGLACQVEFLKHKAALHLPEMSGKSGKLVRAVAKLAAACEISVKFSLSRTHLSITFDPMDLRKLPSGQTLEQVKIAEQGRGRRGRKRKDTNTHYAAHRIKPVPHDERPIHPEWRPFVTAHPRRAIGIDLNPQWIGLTIIEANDPTDLTRIKVLDHRLLRIEVPQKAGAENVQSVLANSARLAISMARSWNAGLIVHEEGLGKLLWSKKNRPAANVHTINYWSRNAFLRGLARRARLSGLNLLPIWGGYSTTIGNLSFDLPDACAAAAEIARRGLAALSGAKDRLPAVPPQLVQRLWKDADARVSDQAATWQDVHRKVKSAQAGRKAGIGYRRLHPTLQALGSGSFILSGQSYAVDRLGKGKGASCSARPVLSRTVRDNSDRVQLAA